MHKPSLRVALLGLTTVSSIYAGLGLKTAQAAEGVSVDNPDESTAGPSARRMVSDTTAATPTPPARISNPDLRPRFADTPAVKVSPKVTTMPTDSLRSAAPIQPANWQESNPNEARASEEPIRFPQPVVPTPDPTEDSIRGLGLLSTEVTPASEPTSVPVAVEVPEEPLQVIQEQADVELGVDLLEDLAPDSDAHSAVSHPDLVENLTTEIRPTPQLGFRPDDHVFLEESNATSTAAGGTPPIEDAWDLARLEPEPVDSEELVLSEGPTDEIDSDLSVTNRLESAPQYQVQSGDTLSRIASEYDISVEALAQANGIQDVNLIISGADLVIPQADDDLVVADATVAVVDAPAAPEAISPAFEAQVSLARLQATARRPDSSRLLQQLQVTEESMAESTAQDSSPIASQSTPPEGPAIESAAAVDLTVTSASLDEEVNLNANTGETADTSEMDVFTASLLQDVESTYDNEPVEIAVVPALPTSAENTTEIASPLTDQSITDRLVAVAPLNTYIRPEPVGQTIEPQMPILPSSQEYLPESAEVSEYIWPSAGRLSSGYGWRWGRMHRGVDIAAPTGTPVMASAPGIIEHAGWNNGGYGNLVDIRHADGSLTRYAHNSRVVVRVGQRVEQGQLISEIGSTGFSTGPHLHFEIHRPNQGTINPIALLPEQR